MSTKSCHCKTSGNRNASPEQRSSIGNPSILHHNNCLGSDLSGDLRSDFETTCNVLNVSSSHEGLDISKIPTIDINFYCRSLDGDRLGSVPP